MITRDRAAVFILYCFVVLLLLTTVRIRQLEHERDALQRQLTSVIHALDSMVAARPRDLLEERDSLVAREARALGLPVQLALAVAWVENRHADSLAVSYAGALGLMQVMTPEAFRVRGDTVQATYRAVYIREVCGSDHNLHERVCNVRVGLRIYRDYLRHHRNEYQALAAYNGALGKPRAAQRYVNAVRIYARALTTIGATQ